MGWGGRQHEAEREGEEGEEEPSALSGECMEGESDRRERVCVNGGTAYTRTHHTYTMNEPTTYETKSSYAYVCVA